MLHCWMLLSNRQEQLLNWYSCYILYTHQSLVNRPVDKDYTYLEPFKYDFNLNGEYLLDLVVNSGHEPAEQRKTLQNTIIELIIETAKVILEKKLRKLFENNCKILKN